MIATRFAVSLHILVLVASDSPGTATSLRMAAEIGTNPVVIRRLAGHLSRAGLITVQRGPGGASLTRPAEAVTLREVWRAIHPERDRLVRVHGRGKEDRGASAVPALLRDRLDHAEAAFLADLDRTSLAELVARAKPKAMAQATTA